MAGILGKAWREFTDLHKTEDGTLDFWSMLQGAYNPSGGLDSGALSTMKKLYDAGVELQTNVYKNMPYLEAANDLEFDVLYKLSEHGIPYELAQKWFNFKEAECGIQNPVLCLPPSVLAYLYVWQQQVAFIVVAFVTILAGGFLGAALSQRRLKGSIIKIAPLLGLSLIIDIVGALSLILPIIGNAFDLVWAPIASFLVLTLTRSIRGSALVFVKELLLVFDFIPLATLLTLYSVLE